MHAFLPYYLLYCMLPCSPLYVKPQFCSTVPSSKPFNSYIYCLPYSKIFCLLVAEDTFTWVFRNNNLLKCHKTEEIKVFSGSRTPKNFGSGFGTLIKTKVFRAFSCIYSVTHPSCPPPPPLVCVWEGCPWVLLVCFWWVNTPCNYHPGPTLITAREKVSESTHQHLLRIHITQVRLAQEGA